MRRTYKETCIRILGSFETCAAFAKNQWSLIEQIAGNIEERF
jgi:hypothetical protein